MTTVDMIVFGLIALAVVGGLIKGFDLEIKNFGKGFFGVLAAVLSCVLFGKLIFSIPQVVEGIAALREWLGGVNGFLTNDIVFNAIIYLALFIVFYITVRLVASLVGAIVGAIFSGALKPANRILGGVFSGAVMLGIIMVAFAVISLIPSVDLAGNVSGAVVEPLYAYAVSVI